MPKQPQCPPHRWVSNGGDFYCQHCPQVRMAITTRHVNVAIAWAGLFKYQPPKEPKEPKGTWRAGS